MKEYDIEDICEWCGKSYGEHIYELKHDEAQCPEGYGIFKLKKEE